MAVICNNACVCNEGFVKTATGECVLPADCPQASIETPVAPALVGGPSEALVTSAGVKVIFVYLCISMSSILIYYLCACVCVSFQLTGIITQNKFRDRLTDREQLFFVNNNIMYCKCAVQLSVCAGCRPLRGRRHECTVQLRVSDAAGLDHLGEAAGGPFVSFLSCGLFDSDCLSY